MANGVINGIAKQIDGKTITSAGGIVVALFLGWILWQVLSNDVSQIAQEVSAHGMETAQIQREYQTVLTDLKGVIEESNQNSEQMRRLIETFLITK